MHLAFDEITIILESIVLSVLTFPVRHSTPKLSCVDVFISKFKVPNSIQLTRFEQPFCFLASRPSEFPFTVDETNTVIATLIQPMLRQYRPLRQHPIFESPFHFIPISVSNSPWPMRLFIQYRPLILQHWNTILLQLQLALHHLPLFEYSHRRTPIRVLDNTLAVRQSIHTVPFVG